MAICKIGGLLLRHFSFVFNGTTAAVAVRSHFAGQGSGTYGSRARCGSFDDGIWLAGYFLNTIVTNETSVIFNIDQYLFLQYYQSCLKKFFITEYTLI